jgi:hypothetical protein
MLPAAIPFYIANAVVDGVKELVGDVSGLPCFESNDRPPNRGIMNNPPVIDRRNVEPPHSSRQKLYN